MRMVWLEKAAPATPITRLKLESSPSLAPSTAALRALPPLAALWRPSRRAMAPPSSPVPGAASEIAETSLACERSSAGSSVPAASGWPS